MLLQALREEPACVNGAVQQLQLDVYGEALDAIFRAHGQGHGIAHAGWEAIRAAVDWVAANWDRPEEGASTSSMGES